MLSDVVAMVIALVSVRIAARSRRTSRNTFGWARAEDLGALVNAGLYGKEKLTPANCLAMSRYFSLLMRSMFYRDRRGN